MKLGRLTSASTQLICFTLILILTSIYNGPGDRFFLLACCWLAILYIFIAQNYETGTFKLILPIDKLSFVFYLLGICFVLNVFFSQAPSHTSLAIWAYLIPIAVYLLWMKNTLLRPKDLWPPVLLLSLIHI